MVVEGLLGKLAVSLERSRARKQGFLFDTLKDLVSHEYSSLKIFSRDGNYFEKGSEKPLQTPSNYYCSGCSGFVKGEAKANLPKYIYLSDDSESIIEYSCGICYNPLYEEQIVDTLS